jgi:hypothetical protein
MILVDFSPVTISAAFRDVGDGAVPDPEEFREEIFKTLGNIRMKNHDDSGEMVIAMDSKPYWRKDIFPSYKGNRKKLSGIHWNVIDEVKSVLHERVPWKILEIPRLEADDIIGVLVHHFAPRSKEHFMIVSPDGDFKQLQIYNNVEQIDIIRGREVTTTDPKAFLREIIIGGQTKDAIPNILSDADTHTCKEKRQSPMMKKNLQQWIHMDPSFFCDDTMMKRYRENEKLVDLSKVPDEHKKAVIYAYALAPHAPEKSLRSYFIENRMAELADNVGNFT